MDLLTNAVESIQVGVEDYNGGSRPRLLSAVRNIHAGILLLYKEALLRASPPDSNEALIKARIEPIRDADGDVTFVGVGRKTVDTRQIRERFDSLGIHTDWKLLESITSVRNDIEHYFPNVTHDAIRGVVASAFILIRRFTSDELEKEPRTLLGQPTWDAMLAAAELHAVERAACDVELEKVAWESDALDEGIRELRCPDCGSDLLRPIRGSSFIDVELECVSCGMAHGPDGYIPLAVEKALEWESYVAMDDGDEQPYTECPECFTATYVLAENRCAGCGASVERECIRCGNSIPASELASAPLCGYCEHIMSKDD